MLKTKTHHILVAEDDPDDILMLKDAFNEAGLATKLYFVENGSEVFEYLNGENQYANRDNFPLPSLIILDLNMPKVDGREALKWIKEHENFKFIPVTVFTTSDAEGDINLTYKHGVNCYIKKPDSFLSLIDIVKELDEYWFTTVTLPERI